MTRINPVSLILISSMGPYIIKSLGIRLEHILIYFVFIWVILNNYKININSFIIFILLIIASIIPLIGEFISNNNTSNYAQIIAGSDNYILFASVFFISATYFNKNKDPDLFFQIVILNLNLLVLNTIIALISTTGLISEILFFFHSTTIENLDIGVESVSALSAKMNRFSGIFDQPLEAGLSYSIGMLSSIYIYKIKKITTYKFIIYIIMLNLGGVLTVSKVFIYGGLPLSIIYYCIINKSTISLIFLSLPVIVLTKIVLLMSGGSDFFERLLDFNNLIDNIIYGRYDVDSNIIINFEENFKNNLIFGLGYTGRSIYDSGYFQYFIQGGILQLALQVFLLIYLTLMSRLKSPYFFLLIIFINFQQFMTLLGGPTILSNRSSVYLGIMYACITNFNFKKI